jgi:hypothetical protein
LKQHKQSSANSLLAAKLCMEAENQLVGADINSSYEIKSSIVVILDTWEQYSL